MSRTIVVYSVLRERISPDDLVLAMRGRGVSATFKQDSPKPKKDPRDWTGGDLVAEGSPSSFLNVSVYPLTPREKKALFRHPEKAPDPAVVAVLGAAQTYYAFSLSDLSDLPSIGLAGALVASIASRGDAAVYDSDVDRYVPPADFDSRLRQATAARGKA